MDYFGCEFIDDGKYGRINPSRIHEIIHLPFDLIAKCTDQRYLSEISYRDRNYILELRASISSIGLKEPLLLAFDSNSIYLQDGNHRLLAMKPLGIDYVPVNITEVTKIQRKGLQFKDLFTGDFLNAISKR